MDNIDHKDLDAIFRDGADKHEFSYNDAAWQSLSDRLDKKERNRKIFPFLLFGLLLITSGLVYLLSSNTSSNDGYSIEENATIAKHTESKTPIAIKTENSTLEGSTALNTQNDGGEEKTEQLAINETSETVGQAPQVNNTSSYTIKKATRQFNTVTTISAENRAVNNAANEANNFNNNSRVESPQPNELSPLVSNNSIPVVKDRRLEETVAYLSLKWSDFTTEQRIIAEASYASVPERNTTEESNKIGYSLGVFAGPEWSSVGLFGDANTGWKAGLTFGLPVTRNIELSTGVGVSRKIYSSQGESYDMKDGWIDDIKPETMDSKGYIVDIPLNLTYYATDRRSNGFYFTGGVSSYFMSSEWYGFNYSQADLLLFESNGKEPMEEVFEQNINKHYFGVGNIALGYQTRLFNGYMIQFSPYLQVPFAGIGSGNVDLYTTGVTVGLKFNK